VQAVDPSIQASDTLEDRGSEHARIAKAAALLLDEPKPSSGQNLRAKCRPDVDKPDAPRGAVNGIDYALQHRVEGFSANRIEEVTHREIVGYPKVVQVGNDDFDVAAPVLTPPRRQTGARDLRQGGGYLDTDNSAEGPSCRLVDNATLSTSEFHKSVAIGDAEVMKCSGQNMPGRWHVALAAGASVLRLIGIAGRV